MGGEPDASFSSMLVTAARAAIGQLLSPPFRSVLWKSLGLTIAMLIALWFVLELSVSTFLAPFLGPWPWVTTALAWLLGAGIVVGAPFLIAPVSSVFAGLFLDDVAEAVERRHYGEAAVGRALPVGRSIRLAVKFLGLVVVANLVALVLFLVLGLGVIVFFVANGYLLGREYFQFAALRHVDRETAEALRARHATTIFLAGMMIAGVLSVPVVNLVTPLFAAALMVHVFKRTAAAVPVSR